MIRLFVGLELPLAARERLALLGGGIFGARWVPAENYHITLRFLGELPAHRAEDVDHALAGVSASGFALSIAGVGLFEKAGRPASLFAGVERSAALDHLQNKIETAVQRTGLAAERRRFTPHVTLARLDGAGAGKLASFVQAHNLLRVRPIPVEHFTLFSSRLGKQASVYTPEVAYKLRPRVEAAA